MVSAPLIVLLYDRTFLAGSFREAWRRRWGYYLALAATWPLLAWLVAQTGLLQQNYGQARMIYMHSHCGPTCLREPGVIAHYLRQVFWPSGLCLDYGWPAAATAGDRASSGDPCGRPAGPDGLGSSETADLGVPGRVVLPDPCADLELSALAGGRGFRAPHVPAAGGGAERRGGRRMPDSAMAGAPRQNSAGGDARAGGLHGGPRRNRTRDRHFPAKRELPQWPRDLAGYGGQSAAQLPRPQQPRARPGRLRTGRRGNCTLPEGLGNPGRLRGGPQ